MKQRPPLWALVRSAGRTAAGGATDGRDWFVRFGVLMWVFVILCFAYRAFLVGALFALVAGLVSAGVLVLELRAIQSGRAAEEAEQERRGREAWRALPGWKKGMYLTAGFLGVGVFVLLRWLATSWTSS